MKKIILMIPFVALLITACGGPPGGGITPVDSTADLSTCTTAGTADQSADAEIEAMRQAMLTFRDSLSDDLRLAAQNCLDSSRLYLWHNTPANGARHGITYGDLSDEQLAHFQTLS